MAFEIIDIISAYEKEMENCGWCKTVKNNSAVLTEAVFYNNSKSECHYEASFFTKKLDRGIYELYIHLRDYITVYNTKSGEIRYITETEYISGTEYSDKEIWKRSVGKTVTVYDAFNNQFTVPDYELYKYLSGGMTTEMKKVSMYSVDGSEIKVGVHLVDSFENMGYFTEPVIKMYSAQGKWEYVGRSQAYMRMLEGWSETPFLAELYSFDGKAITVKLHEKDEYISNGWYEEKLVPLYSADGETMYTTQEQKEYYIACGWSEQSYSQEKNESGVHTVYITPGGKKYHLSKSCAGTGAITVNLYEVEDTYDPCRTCCS